MCEECDPWKRSWREREPGSRIPGIGLYVKLKEKTQNINRRGTRRIKVLFELNRKILRESQWTVLRDMCESIFEENGRRGLTPEEKRVLELLRSISLYNRLKPSIRDVIKLVFRIGMGILGYMIY